MRTAYVILLFAVLHGLPAISQTTTGKATTSGPCSPAMSGNNNTIVLKNCGVSTEQGKKLIDLLTKVLANQDFNTINTKLDELLRVASRSNPYASVTTYEPNGFMRSNNESTGMNYYDQSAQADFKEMLNKQNANDWQGLIICRSASDQQISRAGLLRMLCWGKRR